MVYAVKSASGRKNIGQAREVSSKTTKGDITEPETPQRALPSREAAKESMRKLKEWIDDDNV